jgi:hypothetical protein
MFGSTVPQVDEGGRGREGIDMQGYVHTINRRKGLIAVATDTGFTIAQLRTSEPLHLGDRLEWTSNALGATTFFNHTKGADVSVRVLTHRAPEPLVRQWLKL